MTENTKKSIEPSTLGQHGVMAKVALEAALTRKSQAPQLLDVREICSYTDHILVVSGGSARQVYAISETIEIALKNEGHDPISREGERGSSWMLLDFGDLVIHVFEHDLRDFYDIEGLWSDAKVVPIDVPPELRVPDLYAT